MFGFAWRELSEDSCSCEGEVLTVGRLAPRRRRGPGRRQGASSHVVLSPRVVLEAEIVWVLAKVWVVEPFVLALRARRVASESRIDIDRQVLRAAGSGVLSERRSSHSTSALFLLYRTSSIEREDIQLP